MMIMPTIAPSIVCETRLQVYAATGATITPPMMSGMVMFHRKASKPNVTANVATIAEVVKNSAKFTEPITYRGSVLFAATSVDVQIGPHPPPPTASTAPPVNPKARRKPLENSLRVESLRRLTRNLTKILIPKTRSNKATTGLIVSPGMLTRMYAPMTPPTVPVHERGRAILQSTFPNLRCETPETKLENISAVCTDAETNAGKSPAAIRTAEDVAPYPMPRTPSTYWTNNPNTRIKTNV